MDSFTESQRWPRGACDQAGPLWGQGQVHAQKGCGGELTVGPVQNQVMNLPHKHRLKLVGVIMVKAILSAGVLLSSIGTAAGGRPALVSSKLEPQELLFVSWGKLSMYISS